MKEVIGILFLVIILFSCSDDRPKILTNGLSIEISPVEASLIDSAHNSEGFLVTLKSGEILHFFRRNEKYEEGHTGNAGKIVQRSTLDGGLSWSKPITVYSDSLDDRNIHGGITIDGTIVIFFRRFNATSGFGGGYGVDLNFIYSEDKGITWSEPNVMPYDNLRSAMGTHKMILVPGRGYMHALYEHYSISLTFSSDGKNWSDFERIYDYRKSKNYFLNESCFTYVNDGIIIGLSRDNSRDSISNFYQMVSSDYGMSWAEPQRTNIVHPYFCPSPQLLYDQELRKIIVVATDRRDTDIENSKLWIYTAEINQVVENPKGYELLKEIKRPDPNHYIFYGYPSFTETQDGYLLLITESNRRANRLENADFYQFTINKVRE